MESNLDPVGGHSNLGPALIFSWSHHDLNLGLAGISTWALHEISIWALHGSQPVPCMDLALPGAQSDPFMHLKLKPAWIWIWVWDGPQPKSFMDLNMGPAWMLCAARENARLHQEGIQKIEQRCLTKNACFGP